MNRTSLRLALAACFVALVVGGCAESNIKPDHRLEAARSNGVVAGSITYAGAYAAYGIELIGPGDATHRIQHGQSQTFNFVKAFSGEDPHAMLRRTGSPFAVELPAGEYRIESWYIFSGVVKVRSQQRMDVVFRVLPGQAIYLGNLDFVVTDTVMRNPGAAAVTLRDARTRDLPAIRAEFPALGSVPMTSTLAPGTVTGPLGGAGRSKVNIPVYIPM